MIHDDDAWLEDDADPAVMAWQNGRDALAQKELAASPNLQRVRAAVEATFADVFGYPVPQPAGGHWFEVASPAAGGAPQLRVYPSLDADARVLFDSELDPDGAEVVSATPSPNGRMVVVQLRIGQQTVGRLLDAHTGAAVGPDLPSSISTAWAADSSGFYRDQVQFGETAPDGTPRIEAQLWWQPLDGAAQREDLSLDQHVNWVTVSPDGRFTTVFSDLTNPCPTWIKRENERWRRFFAHGPVSYRGALVDEEFWAVTDDTSGWQRLVAIPIRDPLDRSRWRELVPPEAGRKLSALSVCGSRVVLLAVRDGVSELVVLDQAGEVKGPLPLPGRGAAGSSALGFIHALLGEAVLPEQDSCLLVYSALDHSPALYRADLINLQLTVLRPPAHVLSDRVIDIRTADGPAGPVTYRIFHKVGTRLDGRTPTIVTGYGGFGVPWLPVYSAMAAAWTELGGIWVHCHLRGGGEGDHEFRLAGSKRRKQGCFDDLFAVVEDLHSSGVSTPARTGVWGSSNGGLLVGAAVTQRPELFAAAVAQVPFLDMVSFVRDPHSVGAALTDYGNPADPEDSAAMQAYSPYHRVATGVGYPAVFFDAGADDSMCPPWHSRKTYARMERSTSSGKRLLLRVRPGLGHNQMTAQQWIERDTDELVFFADELGLGREDMDLYV